MAEERRVSLRIRLGEVEVEVKGTWDDISKAWRELPNYVKSMESLARGTGVSLPPETIGKAKVKVDVEEPPFLKEKPKTLKDLLLVLFKTPWGTQPRAVAEVQKALKANGQQYANSAVSTALIRHVRGGRLRRISRKGVWAYVAP